MKNILSLAIALVALFSVNTVFAQSVKEHAPTTFTKDTRDQSLIVCYDIAGLGNVSSVEATVTYDVTVNTFCTTKGKGHPDASDPVPGHSSTTPGETTTVTLPVRNGRARGCTDVNNTITCADACPNGLNETCTASYSNVSISILGKTFTANPQ